MIRTATWLAAAAMLVLLGGTSLWAQDAWPQYASGLPDPHAIQRGPGFYLAIYKLVLLLMLFWAWVKSADWVSRDSVELGDAIGMPYRIWNPIVVFTFVLVFMTLGLGIPIFFAGFAVALLAYLVPFAIYVVQRNGKVTDDKKVFTPEHLKNWFKNIGKRGPKQEREVQHPWQMGPPVEINAVGPLQQANQAAMIDARQSPGFVPNKFVLAEALEQRADKVMLDFTADAVAIRYQIDGVWHNANPKVHEKQALDRPLGDAMLAVFKRISHLNVADRRSKQEGKLRIEFGGNKYDTTLVSQGTQTGERAVLSFLMVTKGHKTLTDLGMRDKHQEKLKELIGPGAKGMVAFCAMPGDGLSNTWQASLRSTDRLLRDFITIEDVNKHEPDVENVDITRFNPAEGETPEKKIPPAILRQPEVICVPEVASGEVLRLICDWIENEDKLSLVSLRAKEASEALLRLMALKPGELFPSKIKAVINQRLIRKLCEGCREAIQPTPEMLQRLGIPAGRVQVLYREKQPLPPGVEPPKKKKGEPEVCPSCRGLGYRGRTAIYEILVVDDKIREALVKQPKLDVIKQLSRQAGNRTLQEEGVLLIAMGVTSVAELQRVLKQ